MLARSVTLNVLGTAASMALGFVGSVLLARWLGPSDRGLLALLTSISTLALTLTSFGLPMAVLYYASLPDRSSRRLLGTTLVYGVLLAVVLTPLAWVFRRDLADAFARGGGGWSWVLAAALVPLTFVDWTTHNQLLGKLRFGLYNVLGIVGKAATLVLIVALVVRSGFGVAGALIAAAAGSIVMIAGSLPPLLADGRPAFDRRLLATMGRYGARAQVGVIFSTLNYRLDVVILQFFRPLSEVGFYVVAQVIAELVLVLERAFQSSVIPLVAGSEGESRERTTILAVRNHGILALAACVFNVGFGTLLILVAYGKAYQPALVPMLIILPGIWFLGTGSVVTSDLRGRGRPGIPSIVSAVTLIVTVALDFALIPSFGVRGAAAASLVAYTFYGVASLVVLSRISGVPVRTLIRPTGADLAAYRTAARALAGRMRGRRPARVPPGA
jgi:O-antigen/teichoic acid export membrane protein